MTNESQVGQWPGVAIVVAQWMLWLGASRVAPGTTGAAITGIFGGWIGPLAGGDEMSEQR